MNTTPERVQATPEDVTWRICREMITLVGSGRALLLQASHPALAGSALHDDPWRSLFASVDQFVRIVFGRPEDAAQATAALRERFDPEALEWTWAVVVDTAADVYCRFVAQLDDDDLGRFYEEQTRFAQALGIRPRPATWRDFGAWFEAECEHLVVTEDTFRCVERPIGLPWPLLPVLWPTTLATVGLLPAAVREQVPFEWTSSKRRAFEASVEVARRLVPLLPTAARRFPEARAAATRFKRSSGS